MDDSSVSAEISMNVIELMKGWLHASGAEGLCQGMGLRRNPKIFADATMRFASASWRDDPAGKRLEAHLASIPEAASVRAKGKRLTIRFSDDLIAAFGEALELGQPVGMLSPPISDESVLIDFYGANATKALHVGHLRNLAIGNGLAAAFSAAGARVTTMSLSGDVGRQISEAMAGYKLYRDGQDPVAADMKPDHFVGAGYTDYVREFDQTGEASAADAPIAREIEISNDLAQEYMQRWHAGDHEIRALWEKIRGWAIAGQGPTLQRLGVKIDRLLYESEIIDRHPQILEEGIDSGILKRDDDGSVVYETGKIEYPFIVLLRRDGIPTWHLRDPICLGMLLRESADEIDRYIQFCGDEWMPAMAVYREILARLRPGPFNDVHTIQFHGMVTLGGSKIKSTGVRQPRIDDLLDRVIESQQMVRLVERYGALEPLSLARIVLLGHFVSRSPEAAIEFVEDHFVQDRHAHGWLLARAWCRANGDVAGSQSDPDPAAPSYRFAVMQSQRFRRSLADTVASHDPSKLSKYLVMLCRWYLDTRADRRIDRLMRTILQVGLGSLGLLPSADARNPQNGTDAARG